MTINNQRVLERAMRKHASVRKPLLTWIEITRTAAWQNIIETRTAFSTADAIKGTSKTCFNIGGNNFRLIAIVDYEAQQVYVDEVLAHSDYTKKYT